MVLVARIGQDLSQNQREIIFSFGLKVRSIFIFILVKFSQYKTIISDEHWNALKGKHWNAAMFCASQAQSVLMQWRAMHNDARRKVNVMQAIFLIIEKDVSSFLSLCGCERKISSNIFQGQIGWT